MSLGDLAIEVKQDEQPTYEQISKARELQACPGKDRACSLVTDATFNEGGLLERIADNPEGLVDHYLTFDKSEDGLQSSEFTVAKIGRFFRFRPEWRQSHRLANCLSWRPLFPTPKWRLSTGSTTYADSEGAGFSGYRKNRLPVIRPSVEMLKMYYEDIRKFGNDRTSVGVDGILKKYAAKYKEYDDLYGKTLDLLEVQTPLSPLALSTGAARASGNHFRHHGGNSQDRKKLLPYLSSTFKGMDADISTEVAKFRTAIFVNPDYASKFKGYLEIPKLGAISENLSPNTAFATLSGSVLRWAASLGVAYAGHAGQGRLHCGWQLLTPKKRLSRCEPRGSCLDGRKAHCPKFDRGCSSGHGAVDPSFRGYRWRISF